MRQLTIAQNNRSQKPAGKPMDVAAIISNGNSRHDWMPLEVRSLIS
jgi:hypothetical protein